MRIILCGIKIMKAKTAAVSAILLGMLIMAAGCAGQEGFTREELNDRNIIEVIFAAHSSARVESNFYGMHGEDLSQSTVHIKRNGRIVLHTSFSLGSGYTVEPDGVYFYDTDVTHGMYAFFDDGCFETYYLPYLSGMLAYTPIEGNTFISETVKDNVRTLVYHADIANVEAVHAYGVYSGVLETTYTFDAKTGFLMSERYVAVTDGESRLLSDRTMTYGQDDELPEPEYVTRVKDTSETRTVRFIMPDGEVFAHVLAKDAVLIPLPLEEYGYFEDPAFTVPYRKPDGGYHDETVIYVKADGDAEQLVVYTSIKDTLIMALADDFKSKHPDINVDVRIDGAGTLMAQIESERGAGKILADLIWTSEIPDFYYMKDEGLLLQYRPAGADSVFNPLEDTGDYFIPARLGTMGIAYNTDIIQTPPESWRDLLGPDYAGGFAFANPETSGTALMAVVLLTEAFGEEFFRELRANGAFIGQGSTWVVEAVAGGELAAGLAVDYITFDKAKSGSPIAIVYPREMIVIPSPVAIFKDSPNTAAAKKFVDYLITPEAQRLIKNTGTLPVLNGIPVSGEYNIPPAAEAMARAIDVNEAGMMTWKDEIVGAFVDIMK